MSTTEFIDVKQRDRVFIITLQKPPENRLTEGLCQTLIKVYRTIEKQLSEGNPEPEGAVILKGKDAKFFTTVCTTISPSSTHLAHCSRAWIWTNAKPIHTQAPTASIRYAHQFIYVYAPLIISSCSGLSLISPFPQSVS